MPPSVDWKLIRLEYETTQLLLKDLAAKHGLSDGTVRSRKNREGWQRTLVTPDNATQRTQSEPSVATPPKEDICNKAVSGIDKDFPQCEAISHKTRERCRRQALAGERFCRIHLDGWPGQCTASSKQTGERCKKKAEPGKQVCRIHGGAPGSGAPPGSKNALKTGEYEAIWKDTLDDDERDLYEQIETDPLAQIDDTIRLLSLRERRMMQRIQRLKDGLTEKQRRVLQELKTTKEAHEVYDEKAGSMKVVIIPRAELVVSEIEETEFRAIDDIIRLEEALTRVQEKRIKAIEAKHKIVDKHGLNEERLQIERERLEIEKAKAGAGGGLGQGNTWADLVAECDEDEDDDVKES